jgi:hypothetical protein
LRQRRWRLRPFASRVAILAAVASAAVSGGHELQSWPGDRPLETREPQGAFGKDIVSCRGGHARNDSHRARACPGGTRLASSLRICEKITKCRVVAGFLAWPRREGGGNTRSGLVPTEQRRPSQKDTQPRGRERRFLIFSQVLRHLRQPDPQDRRPTSRRIPRRASC